MTDSRHVIRVENMVTRSTSSLEEVLGVDLNGAMSNYLRLALLVLLSSTGNFSLPDYVDPIR